MSSVAFDRKLETCTFHAFAKSVIAGSVILCALSAPARAATKVAVIDATPGGGVSGVSWCNPLTGSGYDCTLFPHTGPTTPLAAFQVVIDLSETWTDPTSSLADFMRARKGVILWHGAPGALGIETDPIVQAWVGAKYLTLGNGVLLTTASDPILGSTPPGTIIGGCGDGPCAGLGGESEFPNAKVLARWEFGTSSVGILRNTWEGGQSVYFPLNFGPSDPFEAEILLRTVGILSRPIPTMSAWGVTITALVLLIAGSVLIRRRHRLYQQNDSNTDMGFSVPGAIPLFVVLLVLVSPDHRANAQPAQSDMLIVRTSGQTTELLLNDPQAPPFHATQREVQSARVVGVPGSTIVLSLWDEIQADGRLVPFYAVSLDGHAVQNG